MDCPHCGFYIATPGSVCPQCGQALPAPPPQQIHITSQVNPGRAVATGFFAMLGVWLASLGLGCAVPLVGCGILGAIGLILTVLYAVGSVHH